jgi:hypothetical protein
LVGGWAVRLLLISQVLRLFIGPQDSKAVKLQGCCLGLPGCRVVLQGCEAARLQGCTAARLQGCKAAWLQGCKAARLSELKLLQIAALLVQLSCNS